MVKCEKLSNKYVSNEHRKKSVNFPVTLVWGENPTTFFLPNMHNTVDCKVCIDEDDIEELIDQATMCPHDYSEEFEEFTEETGLVGGLTSLKGIQSTCRRQLADIYHRGETSASWSSIQYNLLDTNV